MKKTNSDEGVDPLNAQVPARWLDELERSHYVLESIIASLPADTQRELIELLEVLAKGDKSQELISSARGKASRIVAELCKQDQADDNRNPSHESARRTGDRRNQDRRQEADNSHKPWTAEQIRTLQILAEQNIPTRRIARKLGRTSTAIESKAKEINVSLNHNK